MRERWGGRGEEGEVRGSHTLSVTEHGITSFLSSNDINLIVDDC